MTWETQQAWRLKESNSSVSSYCGSLIVRRSLDTGAPEAALSEAKQANSGLRRAEVRLGGAMKCHQSQIPFEEVLPLPTCWKPQQVDCGTGQFAAVEDQELLLLRAILRTCAGGGCRTCQQRPAISCRGYQPEAWRARTWAFSSCLA